MSRGRILIVDGSVNARRALRELLTDDGYEVADAADRAAALSAATTFRPDVALIDISHPDGGEVPLASMIAAAPAALFMSSRERPAHVPACRFLPMPLDLRALFAAVADAVADARKPRSS